MVYCVAESVTKFYSSFQIPVYADFSKVNPLFPDFDNAPPISVQHFFIPNMQDGALPQTPVTFLT